MLARVGVVSGNEARRIIRGLQAIERKISAGGFKWRAHLEDVHMNIEAALIAHIGKVGKKLHTGRSRNDQVATDMRLYLRDEIDVVSAHLLAFMSVL
jgi:argininosuccinate lyase